MWLWPVFEHWHPLKVCYSSVFAPSAATSAPFLPLASLADLCSCFLVSSPSHFCSRFAVGSPDTSQHLLLVPSPQLGRGMESSSGRSLFVPVLSCHADIADLEPNFASGSLSLLCCDMSVIRCSQLLWSRLEAIHWSGRKISDYKRRPYYLNHSSSENMPGMGFFIFQSVGKPSQKQQLYS